jgi:hypothetical protein
MSDNIDEKGQVFLLFTKSVEVLFGNKDATVHFHAHGRRHGPVSQHPPPPAQPMLIHIVRYNIYRCNAKLR